MDHVDPGADKATARFLLDDETLVVAQRQHWMALAKPVGMAVSGLFLALIGGFSAPANYGVLTDLAWKLWFILLAYAAWRFIQWRVDWFLATDKRLLMTYGVLKRRVAMMPLAKVTDMSFNQTLLARPLRYGQFILESAGREQALRQIDYIRDAKETYLAIVGEIFGEVVNEDVDDAPEERDPDDTDPFLARQLAAARAASYTGEDPTDVPIRPIGKYQPRPERPRQSGLRRRILRRANETPPRAFGHENDVGWNASPEPQPRRQPRDLSDD
ncbi:PH domain-containing protein [Flexivirga caeni]|uniref:PH domain-containing protein n=1 Tax=Flexivirga caeni TaxID=2294115 RepID=A0A3M9MIJ7_9MICO|nr:PH domain-containing protein [Flexivirga caeni]RNI25351.1 PH domain-containing protein [Flexivirga caeni]